ncbi:MAG: helix-turn-helix domain-containing protein [Thermoplasmatales archaeon]|nr:MAG: helix-turn-helix domain-containing protein [Thermoplasmatales archaeon]
MKSPCEIIVWHVLPVIRKDIAMDLIEDHGLNQKQVAGKLGITEAVISRYLSGERRNLEIDDNVILNGVRESANRFVKSNSRSVIEETRRICNILKSKEFIEGINYVCR